MQRLTDFGQKLYDKIFVPKVCNAWQEKTGPPYRMSYSNATFMSRKTELMNIDLKVAAGSAT